MDIGEQQRVIMVEPMPIEVPDLDPADIEPLEVPDEERIPA